MTEPGGRGGVGLVKETRTNVHVGRSCGAGLRRGGAHDTQTRRMCMAAPVRPRSSSSFFFLFPRCLTVSTACLPSGSSGPAAVRRARPPRPPAQCPTSPALLSLRPSWRPSWRPSYPPRSGSALGGLMGMGMVRGCWLTGGRASSRRCRRRRAGGVRCTPPRHGVGYGENKHEPRGRVTPRYVCVLGEGE